jgi:hypothetical protein
MAYNFHNFPKPENRSVTIAENGYNDDIISGINMAFYQAVAQTRAMAQAFKGFNRLASAFNVWSFIKQNVKYNRDPDGMQMIKLPSRLLHEKETGGDCKSFTLLAGSLLKNLGYPVCFRYVSYNNDPTPSHIYCLTYDKDNSPIIVDAVYKKFNAEVPYRHKRDYLMKLK